MANCTMCTKFDECPWRSDPESLCSAYEQRAMTNADLIRQMSDEELAETLMKQCSERSCPQINCFKCWTNWLKQEAENNNEV